METEVVTKKAAPSKRAAAARKSKSSLTISDDEDDDKDGEALPAINEEGDDEDFEMVEAPKGKGKKGAGAGRKPANAKAKATAATNGTRKRGGAQGKSLVSQKLITDVLKPAENASSPEKKVRRMRASPFNKKSGSILGRAAGSSAVEGEGSAGSLSSGSLEAEVNGVAVARNRPKRENRAKILYVESGSEEEEEEEPATEDSDFEEDDD